MSEIHYFQRYSQRENVTTNNTMLLFSRLYNESTYKFKRFINALLESQSIEVGINFGQQIKGKNSIPDGNMSQKSFKVIIETKLWSGKNFDKSQLLKHLDDFENEESKVLVALSPTKIDDILLEEVNEEAGDLGIGFVSTTFQEIIKQFNEAIEGYDIQLKEIIEDYENYCLTESLLSDKDARIRLIPCGASHQMNMKYGIYYMPSSRGTRGHSYVGIYTNKKVIGIGKIVKRIVANIENGELIIKKGKVTQEQKKRILGIISETHSNKTLGWDLGRCDHEYTIVEKFHETNYKKTSKGGIQGHRYQNLKDVLDVVELPCEEEIAKILRNKEWK